jgi:hypothetical protein
VVSEHGNSYQVVPFWETATRRIGEGARS